MTKTTHPADQYITTRPVFHTATCKGFYLDVPNGPRGAFSTRGGARGAYTRGVKPAVTAPVAVEPTIETVDANGQDGPQIRDEFVSESGVTRKTVQCVCGQLCCGDVTRVTVGTVRPTTLLTCGHSGCTEIAISVLRALACTTRVERWWDFPAANHVDRVEWFRRAARFAH